MNTRIESSGFTIDQDLRDYINTKSQKLSNFYDKIIDLDFTLKLDSHQKVKDKVIHVKCNIPNDTLFAEHSAKTFEEATNGLMDQIIVQIKKIKDIRRRSKGNAAVDKVINSNEFINGFNTREFEEDFND